MKPANPHPPVSFVARLVRWKKDRGALARFRCGLRAQPALCRRAWPLLAQLVRLNSPSFKLYATVAGLWAADPENHRAGAGNFGVTCHLLRHGNESFDPRFRRLLASGDREELCEHLVPVALAARARGIAVDFDTLFHDLQAYAGEGRDQVRLRWAQAYWGLPADEISSDSESPATP